VKRAWVLALLGVVFIAVADCGAEFSNVAALFQLGTGGRPLGMGGGFLALADDENAAFYNPAGLGWIERIGVTSLLARQFEAVTYGTLGLTLPYFGVTVLQIDSGWITNADDGLRYVSRGGVIASGFSIGPLGVGVRWKLYRVREPYTAEGWALDPAILMVTDIVRVGFLVENLYSQAITFEGGHTEEWETGMRVGAAITLRPSEEVRWNAVFEASGLFSTNPIVAGGLEAWVGGLAARVGYDGSGTTFGLTVQFANFQVDWAYATRLDLLEGYCISLTFRF